VSNLYAAHEAGQVSAGVDIESEDSGLVDASEKQIYDVLAVKAWAIKMAAYAANTILSVDQVLYSDYINI
jgi:T-complex protein 1 subunit theta